MGFKTFRSCKTADKQKKAVIKINKDKTAIQGIEQERHSDKQNHTQ